MRIHEDTPQHSHDTLKIAVHNDDDDDDDDDPGDGLSFKNNCGAEHRCLGMTVYGKCNITVYPPTYSHAGPHSCDNCLASFY